jgi:Xaa-Pro aminopeptidase
MVDAAYYDLYKAMKPGMRENEAVALVAERLYDLGSEYVEGVNAISGERCSPHPHVFSDRVLRPGDPVYYDILHAYMGYRTCDYRTFAVGSASRALVDAYKRCRDYLDASIALIQPGRTTAEVAAVWPKAQEFGFPNEEAAFALQMGHGIGLAIWEKPMISPRVSTITRLSQAWSSRSKPSGVKRWMERRAYRRKSLSETGHEGHHALPG